MNKWYNDSIHVEHGPYPYQYRMIGDLGREHVIRIVGTLWILYTNFCGKGDKGFKGDIPEFTSYLYTKDAKEAQELANNHIEKMPEGRSWM